MPHDVSSQPAIVARFCSLLAALRDGPLPRPALLAHLCGYTYPQDKESARRIVDRDIAYLGTLGIRIERSRTRPPVYTLRGGIPVFDAASLGVLSLIRDTFGENHPQYTRVSRLLEQLTCDLNDDEQQLYTRQQVINAPIQPAIDYAPYYSLIMRLEQIIRHRQVIGFAYLPTGRSVPTLHRRVEPYAIEYYERQFYLVGYSHLSGQIHDFRIDRIQDDEEFQLLERLPPEMEHRRPLVQFRYRLTAKLARGDISQRFEEQRVVERLPNGDVIIEACGRSDFFIVRTLLKYADQAELLWPEWLREMLAREVWSMARLYGM